MSRTRSSFVEIAVNPLGRGNNNNSNYSNNNYNISHKLELVNNSIPIPNEKLQELLQLLTLNNDSCDILKIISSYKNGYYFTSTELIQILDCIISKKLQINVIEMIGPRLSDPKKYSNEIINRFRYAEEKEIVQDILKIRAQTLNSSSYGISKQQSKKILSGKNISKQKSTGIINNRNNTNHQNDDNNNNNVNVNVNINTKIKTNHISELSRISEISETISETISEDNINTTNESSVVNNRKIEEIKQNENRIQNYQNIEEVDQIKNQLQLNREIEIKGENFGLEETKERIINENNDEIKNNQDVENIDNSISLSILSSTQLTKEDGLVLNQTKNNEINENNKNFKNLEVNKIPQQQIQIKIQEQQIQNEQETIQLNELIHLHPINVDISSNLPTYPEKFRYKSEEFYLDAPVIDIVGKKTFTHKNISKVNFDESIITQIDEFNFDDRLSEKKRELSIDSSSNTSVISSSSSSSSGHNSQHSRTENILNKLPFIRK